MRVMDYPQYSCKSKKPQYKEFIRFRKERRPLAKFTRWALGKQGLLSPWGGRFGSWGMPHSKTHEPHPRVSNDMEGARAGTCLVYTSQGPERAPALKRTPKYT